MSKLRAFTAQELLERDFPEREDVLGPWLRNGESAVIWAPSGVGKTWMCLSIALAVAGGGTVGPWQAPKARKVLYFDGEMNAADLQERVRDLLRTGAVKVPDKAVALANLTIISRQAQKVGTDFLDMTNRDHQAEVAAMVQGRFELVVLDNLTTLSENLKDENDAAAFKPFQAFFLELKRAGVATILVHHANKGGRDMRGSTAIATTFEVILGLTPPQLLLGTGAAFVGEFGKFRGKRDKRTDPLTWQLQESGWETEEAEPETAKDLPSLKALKSLRYVNQAEIAKALGVDPGTVSRQLAKAKVEKVLSDKDVAECFRLAQGEREMETVEEAQEEVW